MARTGVAEDGRRPHRCRLGRLLRLARGLPMALLTKITQGAGAGTDRLVMRGLQYALIDEADSVLIDDARTPLILSRPGAPVEGGAVERRGVEIAPDPRGEPVPGPAGAAAQVA